MKKRSFLFVLGLWIVTAMLLSACGSSGSGSSTVSSAASQVAPTISSAETLLAPTVESAANQVAPTLSAAATLAAPTLSAAASQAAPTLLAAASQVAPTISAAATQAAPTLSAAATQAPTLAAAASQAVPTLISAATQAAPTLSAAATQVASSSGKTYVLVPKVPADPLNDAVNQGAQQAAKEIGATVNYLGGAATDANPQNQLLSILTQKVAGLAVAGSNSDAFAAAAKQAVASGIPVVSWESPLPADSGALFISPAAPQALGPMLAKMVNDEAGTTGGKIAILSSSATATYPNAWISALKTELQKPENAKLQLVNTIYGNDDDAGSYSAVKNLLTQTPIVKVIVAGSPVASAAAARAVKDANMTGKVFVTGLGTPALMRDYAKSGIATEFAAWNPSDLGYLTIYTLDALSTGNIKGKAGDSFNAGRLNQFNVSSDPTLGSLVVLGTPTLVNKDNIDTLNY